jgi:hypothetical protein
MYRLVRNGEEVMRDVSNDTVLSAGAREGLPACCGGDLTIERHKGEEEWEEVKPTGAQHDAERKTQL